jgi:hypothetical protein
MFLKLNTHFFLWDLKNYYIWEKSQNMTSYFSSYVRFRMGKNEVNFKIHVLEAKHTFFVRFEKLLHLGEKSKYDVIFFVLRPF